MNRFVIGVGGLALTVSSIANAGYVVEDVPTWRGEDNTAHYEWETFASPYGKPNFANNVPPTADAMLFNFGEDAIITGAGNIYGYGGALNIHTYGYSDTDIQDVVFNFATMGTEIDYTGAMLAWNDGTEGGESGIIMPLSDYNMNYYEEVDFGQGPGAIANVSWSFDLSDISADIREIGLIWSSDTNNISLGTASMDLRFAGIPAPGALALLGLAGLAGGRRRRH
ncbi:MAG: MYXO-CTERM domain-containing protein [Phycisphaerales bacterium]|nr:MYXO-CTERM domain-containing protein [Phycisphaerales bacterium]